MKRIALSLATIAAVLTMSIAATGAYFSSSAYVNGNTFSTGSVTLGSLAGDNLNVTNLTPGVWTPAYPFNVPYVGTINADIYAGVTGTSHPGDLNYIANKLTVQVYSYDTGSVVWQGLASDLSTNWLKIATNVPQSATEHYGLSFLLDSSFSTQGVNNIDTVFLIYAVQNGGPAPATAPYLETDWNHLV
jgi:hypothetical protein